MKPLLSFEDYTTVHIEYTHTSPAVVGPPAVAAQDITCKRDVVFCPDTTDKERLLRVIDEYLDACNDTLLHIHDADRYIHFRQVLGGSLKTTWDTIVTTHRNAFAHRTDANFNTDLRHFTRRYLPSNASQLQKEYLENPRTTKPHDFDCYETRARFELINPPEPVLTWYWWYSSL